MANADFVNQVYQTALGLGIPEVQARLAATQAALETNYGKSAPGNNYFGIKGKGQTLATKEASNGALKAINDSFRTYPDLAGSVQGWWDQIQRNWPDAAAATNFGTAIDALNNGRHGRYATDAVEANDPLTYQDKLASINQRFLGGSPLPPANIPSVGTQLDTVPPDSYRVRSGDTLGKIASRLGTTVQQLAQINGIADPNKIRAGATLKVGIPPLPATTFGGRLPAQAQFGVQFGVDRLTPGQVTQPPNDFTTDSTGSFDPRLLGLVGARPNLAAGLGTAGKALPGIGQMGLPFAGRAAGGVMPPMPIPRPAMAPPAPAQAPQPQLPAQRPSAPVAPPQQLLRLPSGQMIAPGIVNLGDHSVQVTDDGHGNAVITKIRAPFSIPGVVNPLNEVNNKDANGHYRTIAGSMIGKMGAAGAMDAVTNFVPNTADNVKSAALGAASNLGNSIGGMFGGLFGGAPKPASWAPWGSIPALPQQRAPVPMSRPLFAQPQVAAPRVPAPVQVAPSVAARQAADRQQGLADTLSRISAQSSFYR